MNTQSDDPLKAKHHKKSPSRGTTLTNSRIKQSRDSETRPDAKTPNSNNT